jgi:hypothetical protein
VFVGVPFASLTIAVTSVPAQTSMRCAVSPYEDGSMMCPVIVCLNFRLFVGLCPFAFVLIDLSGQLIEHIAGVGVGIAVGVTVGVAVVVVVAVGVAVGVVVGVAVVVVVAVGVAVGVVVGVAVVVAVDVAVGVSMGVADGVGVTPA